MGTNKGRAKKTGTSAVAEAPPESKRKQRTAERLDEFAKVLEDSEWHSTAELITKLDEQDWWDRKFKEGAVRSAKAAYVHRMMRLVKDEEDFPLWASLEVTTADGVTVRVYKHENHFTLDDYRQVIAYHTSMAIHHRRMVQQYRRRAEAKFGEKAKVIA